MAGSDILSELSTLPESTYLGGLGLGSLLVAGLLYTQRPPVTRATVVALVPWMVVAPALHAVYRLGRADRISEVLTATPEVYLTTFVIAGLAWLALFQLAALQRTLESLPQYIAASGFGTLVVLVPFAIGQSGIGRTELAALVAVPVVSAAIAAVAFVLLALWYIDAAAYTGVVGGLVAFGHTFDALATVAGLLLDGPGAHTRLSRAAIEVATALPTYEYAGGVWLFVLARLLPALVVVALAARYARAEPTKANVALGALAALGLVPGANRLLVITLR